MAGGGVMQRFGKWFWNEDVWLPPNTTWADIKKTDKVKYAQFDDLYYGFVVALVLLVIRYTLERVVFCPLGVRLGLKAHNGNRRAPDNHLLEKAFLSNGKMGYKQVQGLARQLEWTERRVQRWIRQRVLQEKPSTLAKFTESTWRFTFYFSVFCYGLYALSDKPWLWDTMHCWYDYPHHSVTNDLWWYYMIELGFYMSLTMSQFMDTKRKDFWQMFVHHILTILLLSFSWACNLHRIGSLVLIVHDFADVPLEAAKMAKYVKRQRLADATFAVFTICWLISRLGLYPYRVIYSTMFEAVKVIEMFAAYYIFNSLLTALQFLHIVWTWMIARIALQAISSNGVKDLRSDDESSSDSDESPGQLQNHMLQAGDHKRPKSRKAD
ncbi:ceramide synthase 6 [Ixodes scapularis]|uniref:ceramide synthase 6 n=1 Tax=Ixodes scapularis TaxID=6945 RepID=UPI0011617549|nr:ceramide synthase 6 [Ixodes scapularis]